MNHKFDVGDTIYRPLMNVDEVDYRVLATFDECGGFDMVVKNLFTNFVLCENSRSFKKKTEKFEKGGLYRNKMYATIANVVEASDTWAIGWSVNGNGEETPWSALQVELRNYTRIS